MELLFGCHIVFFFSYVSSVRWDFKVSSWFINRFLYYSFGGGFCLKSPKNSKDWPLCLRMVVLRNTIFCPCSGSGSGSASVDKKQLRAQRVKLSNHQSASVWGSSSKKKPNINKDILSLWLVVMRHLFVVACLWRSNGVKICRQSTERTFPRWPLWPLSTFLSSISGHQVTGRGDRITGKDTRNRRSGAMRQSVEFSPNSPHFCEFDLEPTSLWQKTRSGRVSAGWRYMCVVLSYFFDLIKLESG